MDRINQLRGESGASRDASLDGTISEKDPFLTANESSSKYFSITSEENDSTFVISALNGVSLTSTDDISLKDSSELISKLSPIGKESGVLDSYRIGKQIEAANILSGGVNIFDNDNSYDGNELVIDDNVTIEDKVTSDKIDGNDGSNPFEKVDSVPPAMNIESENDIPNRDTEVLLQIDGKNVNAIDIGNGLYLYRKEGEEELAAVQIIDDNQQQPSFKFLKVRENTEGNLEVYEEIEIEVPKEVQEDGSLTTINAIQFPVKDQNKVISDSLCTKNIERKNDSKDLPGSSKVENEYKEPESLPEINFNLKMKLSESRKSPLIGFTPMTFHSTPNKEGIPLTKTMVNQQLHTNRSADNVKKTIEVHTDNLKQKIGENLIKAHKETVDEHNKTDILSVKNQDLTKLGGDKQNEENENILKVTECTENEPLKFECIVKKDSFKTLSDKLHDSNIESKRNSNDHKDLPLQEITSRSNDDDTDNTDIVLIESPKVIKCDDINSSGSKTSQKTVVIGVLQSEKEIIISKQNDNKTLCDTDIGVKETETKIPENPIDQSINLHNKQEKVREALENSERNSQTVPDHPENSNTVQDISDDIDKSTKPNALAVSSDTRQLLTKQIVLIPDQNLKIETSTSIHKVKNIENESKITNIEQGKIAPNSSETAGESKTKQLVNDLTMPSVGNNPPQIRTDSVKPCINNLNESTVNEHKIESSHIIATNESLCIAKNEQNVDKNTSDSKLKIMPNVQDASSNLKALQSLEAKSNPINNKHSAVPFGKWTEANRQEFLNKIKETKAPVNSSNTNQIKNSNDLNRRDILKKIDSQRQSNNAAAKAHEIASSQYKHNVKSEPSAFKTKPVQDKTLIKNELLNKVTGNKKVMKQDSSVKPISKPQDCKLTNLSKKQPQQINNTICMTQLIDKTIEDMISKKPALLNLKSDKMKHKNVLEKNKLDDIEKKMNEFHGVPFKERPAHELPTAHLKDVKKTFKSYIPSKIPIEKINNVPHLLPLHNKLLIHKDTIDHITTYPEDEIIEHEPVTGDIEMNSNQAFLPTQNMQPLKTLKPPTKTENDSNKETVITEKDFEKFARRNSFTLDSNCIPVKFDGKEDLKEKDKNVYSKNEVGISVSKIHVAHKSQNIESVKIQTISKIVPVTEDSGNKNYPSKLQMAYQSALTAKRQMESPITVIEDKPVKVVFMDSGVEFVPSQLNVQGKELSPAKKVDFEIVTDGVSESMDSDMLETFYKEQDGSKAKTKHQRKQVLTPVESPELELIEPSDLGIEISPKKKRKVDDNNLEKALKNLVPKKSYLMSRIVSEKPDSKHLVLSSSVVQKNAVSALDSLVKAAELIENQSENKVLNVAQTPIKRGRGRPRKYPLLEGAVINNDTKKTGSLLRKPRSINAKSKESFVSSTDDDDSADEMIRENWTMGKINENILCPICNKLFRSENVVFKHVKHCTGPSPNRSESDKVIPLESRETEITTVDSDDESNTECKNEKPKKLKSKDSRSKSFESGSIKDKCLNEKQQNIDIKSDEAKTHQSEIQSKNDGLVCELCGKKFRDLSFLAHHKLKHKKETNKNEETSRDKLDNRTVFSCDTCKKEFRKLHHLVQHRFIHKPDQRDKASTRPSRKDSYEQKHKDTVRSETSIKPSEDHSAGFRCEPCDKSFRKLHHLVEHRETHDGINRQKQNTFNQNNSEKPITILQCDICKKIFRKLHHLVEHKEQHIETSSEKSDSKSSLSTKDIIHECSLCYMVFPNEHSLNKHTINCLRKKKQVKNSKNVAIQDDDGIECAKLEGTQQDIDDDLEIIDELMNADSSEKCVEHNLNSSTLKQINHESVRIDTDIATETKGQIKEIEYPPIVPKRNIDTVQALQIEKKEQTVFGETPSKMRKVEDQKENTPLKKIHMKDKIIPVTKKVTDEIVVLDTKQAESSDDDEIRYMLNPEYDIEETKQKNFMNVRANKRNSLQIERPATKDMVKRRISIQHPPKIPRLKPKPEINIKTNQKYTPKFEPVPSIDSDDSDVKYSFPEMTPNINTKPNIDKIEKTGMKTTRKSLKETRKSLTALAKRKSLGKAPVSRTKIVPSTVKITKKRTPPSAEHRCDCGDLFSSAALLARHAVLAHTPPRRTRQPPAPPPAPYAPTTAKSDKPQRKKSVPSDAKTTTGVNSNTTKSTASKRKSGSNTIIASRKSTVKEDAKAKAPELSITKRKITRAHSGVPVPEKMKSLGKLLRKMSGKD